jgi:Ca2+-binding RTX toxin-like protein
LAASDEDGDTLTFSRYSGPSSGSVTVNPDGTYIYKPSAGFIGSDSFRYRVSDGNGSDIVRSVDIDVQQSGLIEIATPFTPFADSGDIAIGTTNDIALGAQQTAVLNNGNSVVIWSRQMNNGADYDVFARIIDADGKFVTSEFRVNSYTGNTQAEPTVTALADGSFIVAWASFDSTNLSHTGINAKKFDASGNVIKDEFNLDGTADTSGSDWYVPSTPDISALADGGFALVYQDLALRPTGSHTDVRAVAFDADGNRTTSAEYTHLSKAYDQFSPAVAGLANGKYIAVFLDETNQFGATRLRAKFFTTGGGTGNEFTIASSTSPGIGEPQVAGLAGGGFVVTWYADNVDGDGYGVAAKIYNDDGALVGEQFVPTHTTIDDQFLPDVVATPDGGFVIVYTSFDTVFGDDDVWVQRFDSSGGKIGSAVLVPVSPFEHETLPSVAVGPDGTMTVSWIDVPPGENSGQIMARRYVLPTDVDTIDFPLEGTENGDTIFGPDDGVVIEGHGGDDVIDGGDGIDTVVLSGTAGEYDISADGNDWIIHDTVAGRDGTDRVTNVELVRFGDGTEVTISGEPLVFLSKSSISENGNAGDELGVVKVLGANAGEVFTYSLTDDADSRFAIDASTGVVTATGPLDHEELDVASISVNAVGDQGTVAATSFDIQILDENDAPEAEDSGTTIPEDTVHTGSLIVADQDADDLQFSVTEAPTHGTVSIAEDGTYTYTPDENFFGTDTFTYTVTDGNGGTDTALMTIVVEPVNDAPVADSDTLLTQKDAALTFAITDLLANDSDVEGSALTLVSFGASDNGTIVDNGDGTATFTPADGFFGDTSFQYTIADSGGLESTATVTVSVNDPPVANDDAFATSENAVLEVAVADLLSNDTDADGDTLTVTAVGDAANGTVELVGDTVRFTPTEGFAGDASFTYTISDGRGNLTTGTATVAVSAVDDVLWGDDGGDDALFGGAGSDSLYGQGGADNLRGGIGDDLLEGGSGDDVYSFDLGDGSDLIRDFDGEVTTETYTVNGGYWVSNGETTYWQPTTTTHTRTVSTEIDAGRDAIAFGDGISAGDIALSLDGAGNLTISLLESGGAAALAAGLGEASDDQLVVENWIDSKDRIEELRFADGTVIDISNLAEMVEGTATADSLTGTAGQDWIAAGDGDDTVEGDAGNDIISGGAGADTLTGGAGDDLVLGGDGEDTAVIGGAFADSVVTRQQNGTVIVTGADGTDRLIGVEKIRFDDLEIFADGRNNAPVVANEAAGAVEDGGAITVDVLANDLDADGDTLTVTEAVLRDGAEGSVTINPDGTIGFDPGTGFQDLGAGESVVVTIAYTVSDGAGGETEGTVDVTVTGSNDGPVATSDSLATPEDTTLVISAADLIGNDTDADGDALSITGFTQPANGTLSDNGNGTLTFTPGQDFTGETSFTYTVADGNGGTATETVTLTVSNVVDAAQLTVTDAAGTEDGVTPLAIDAQAVSDSDGITGITLSGVPDWATLNKGTENPDGTWSLTPADLDGLAVVPDADASGTFDITVSVTTSDGVDSQVASDTLTVTVAGVADAPVVTATDAAGDEDTAIALDLSAALTDTDGSESLSITVQGVPTGASLSAGTLANGVWTLAAADLAGLTLTPPENFNGEIALTVTATSTEADTGDTATNTTSLIVTVDAVNDAPEAADDTATVIEDGGPVLVDVLANDSDVDGDAMVLTSAEITNGATASIDIVDGKLRVDPGAGFQDLGIGETTDIEISYTVEDAAGVPSTAQVIVTVQGRNDGPVAQADAFTTDEDVPLIISAADLLGNDSDIDGDSLSVLSVTQPANGSLSDNGDGTFTFTPNTDFFGQTSFTYTVTDGNGGSATQTATIDIASVVEPASISASDVTGPEDEAIALNLSIDAGNALDPITGIVVTGLPEGALLSAGTKNADGSWDLTTEELPGLTVTAPPNSDEAFTLTVAVTTTDGIDTSTVSESFTVTSAAVADTPDLSLSNASGLEDNAIALDISAALTDTDGSETLGLRIDGVPAGASLNKGQDLGNGAWALTQADLAGLSLLPAADFNGAIDLTVTATAVEGANGDTSQTVSTLSVTVTPVNDGPETGADFFRTVRGVPITIALSDLTGNDTDVDGDALTVTFVGNAVDGTIVENGDGTVTFTPTEGFFGEAQFDYTISDGNGGTATRTVIVDSSPNDPPVAVDDSFETTEDAAIQIAAADLVANDTDADGDELTVTAVGGALNGTVELIDGIVHFTPEPGFGGQASFTYTVGDGRGDFSTGTATVAVSAVDDVLWGDDGGDDALFGGAGSDSLYGQGGADSLRGGIGDDLLEGGSGDDVYSFDLGDGSDLIRDFDGEVTTETYTVNGGYWVSNGETTYWQPTTTTHTRTVSTEIDAGRDAIAFGDGISAGDIALSLDGAGNLTISLLESGGAAALAAGLGEASDDQLVVENWIDSKDRIEELRFADGTVIDISNLAEMVEGTATADSLTGTAGQDWIAAGDGDDTVEGDAGNDIISGGAGADTLTGGAGDDLVLGGDGEDTAVIGGAFADSVVTRQQNGTVIVTGADGTDRLIGVEKIRFDDLEIFADGRNNAPVVANETAGAVEDGGAITVDVLANDLDADGDTLTVTEAELQDGAEGSVTLNPDGTIGFDPGAGFQDLGAGESVVVTIAYTVSDGAGGETEGTVDVTVTGSNDGPVATSDSLTTAEDTALVISAADLIGNDTDADGDALSITGFTQPANGTLSDNGNGTFTFTPGQDFTGETSFTYTVADGNGGTATETVTLTVSNVVDAAQLTVTDAAGTEDGVTPLTIDAQAVSDSDGITGITLSGVPDWAMLNKGTENPDGTWSLTPADLDGLAVVPDADASGTFDITVSVTTSDGIDSQVASDTLTVTVAGVADAPVVTATDAAGDEDTAIALDLSAALTDTDGSESLSITVQGVPTGASLSAGTLANGVWTLAAADLAGLTLTPPENFNGEIALTIAATSTEADTGDTATNTTSLTITVDAVNDAPEAVDGLSFRTVQGAPITIAGATLLDGATDADGDAVTIQSVGNAENGTVVLNGDGSVTFTPDPGYFGPARFDITVTDGNGGTDVATVDIDSVDNEAPVTGADSFATQENAPILLSAAQLLQNDTDADGDTITLTGVGDAVNGTVALVDGAVQFTPVDGFAGEASFTYTVSDGHGNSSVGTATVTVAAVDDVLWGDDGGDDALFGGAGSDSLYGQDGADTLRGGIGDDLLEGGGGDDVYTFDLGDGSDLIRDFDGEVTTETYTVNGGYWVTNGETTYWQPTTTTHTRTVNNEVDAGQDAIAFGDGITAEDVTLTLVGNNLVIALSGAGAASALGADAASLDQITVENWTDEKDRVEELRFADGTVIDISNLAGMIAGTVNADELVGTSGMDWISGDGGNDVLSGDAGDDVLLGGDGNDWLNGGAGADLLIGGNGDDNYQGFDSTDTIVENADGGTDTLWVTSDYTLTDSNIENLRIAGSPEFDFFEGFTLTGNGAANVINGTVFDDILRGEAGDDTLYGEGGDDIFYGGEGNDHLEAQFVSPYLSSRNQLFGEGGDDTLIGDDTSDILDGGTGSDAMSGGGSDDIYFIDNVGDTIDEGIHFYGTAEHSPAAANLDLGEDLGLNASSVVVVLVPEAGRDTVFTSVSYDFTGTNIENIFATGTTGLTLTGTYDANIIEGTIGADTIFGADGDDIIYGGDGDDDLTGGLGDNEVYGGAGNDSLHAEEEAWSTLAGGTGDDTYYLAGNHALVQENIGEGFDTVISSGDYSADENIERIIGTGNSKLILTGAENTVEIIGNDAGNSIDSYSTKNQILAGGAGNDIISSHSGDDLISGGAGTYDIVAGGLGNDTYLFNPGDGFDELWDSGGFDTIEFGEGISFGDVQIGSSSGNRPVLSFANLISSDRIELMSPDADGFYGIETLAFADGSTADISGLTIADLPETGTVALTDLVTVTPGSVVAETAGDDGETGLDLFSSDAIPMESWSADDEQSAAGDGVELGDMPGEIDYEALFNISGTQSTIVQTPGEGAGDATVSAEVASQMNNLVAAMNTFSGSGSADPGEALAPEETAPTLLTPLWETPSS